ncbi:MFS transporter [Paracoccaceae bacterium]|nr:MFS transporter [Paracoccaceae bacterium]
MLGSQMPMYIILGGLVGQTLTSNLCLSTLPISLIIIGSMISSPTLSILMQKKSRKFGLLIGNAAGLLGSIASLTAIYIEAFELFLLGSFVSGMYMSSQAFYRFAATDDCEDKFKAHAISIVLTGGLVAAILGPSLVKMSLQINSDIPFLYSYLAIVLINLFGPLIFLFLKAPQNNISSFSPKMNSKKVEKPPKKRGCRLIINPTLLVAVICSMIAYGLMNLIMTASPIAIVGCGFQAADAANIVSAHALAMFLPSFFTGKLIDRIGEIPIMALGMSLFSFSIFFAFQSISIVNFYITLILVGVGWNFGYIGATSLLAKCNLSYNKVKVQGLNDFLVFGFVALSSLTSGWLMNCSTASSQAGWKLINLTTAPLALFAFVSIICLWVSKSVKLKRILNFVA